MMWDPHTSWGNQGTERLDANGGEKKGKDSHPECGSCLNTKRCRVLTLRHSFKHMIRKEENKKNEVAPG